MTLLDQSSALHRPMVRGDLPGPGSAALLARQESRESNARVYGRHFPIAVEEASGSFVRDVDGNVFIDFLTGAGVLSLGHGHPELVEVATEQLGRFCHGLDLPSRRPRTRSPTAQLSMLPAGMRNRMKIHFCGPTGANAVDAALKLCKTATGRGDVVAFQGGFHGTTHAAMAVTGRGGDTRRPSPNGMPGVTSSRSPLLRLPAGAAPRHLLDQLHRVAGDGPARPERRDRAAGGGDPGDGAGRGRGGAGDPRVRAAACGA